MEPDEYNFERNGFEDEDVSGEPSVGQPWNPAKIRITTKNFTLREVVEQIDYNEIDLAPEFQREFVWKRRQKTRLIESILLGIPLPAFYFNQEEDGSYQVVDGVQRLSTIHMFMRDSHVLESIDLEYLVDLNGLTFSELDVGIARRFRSAQIVVHVIEPQTPEDIKYDIFNRVNTMGSPLSAQEIRHAMSRAPSRAFLKSLTDLDSFNQATLFAFWKRSPDMPDGWAPDTQRMMNRELALRFCAFSYYSQDLYRSYRSMDTYLVDYLRWVDGRTPGCSSEELERMRGFFHSAMMNAHLVLGDYAFRRLSTGSKRRGPINRAVFEAQALALAPFSQGELYPRREKVQRSLFSLFDDEEYVKSVTVGTGAVFRVDYRLMRTREAVLRALA